jgi:hypothetical protein
MDTIRLYWPNRNQARNANSNQPRSAATAVCERGSQAYVSFDDDTVTMKLKKLSWDPRYGRLRLLPLCVCTF